MTHTIIYNQDTQTIEIKFQGDITFNEVIELYSESAKVVKQQNCFVFLSDYTDATMKLSTFEIYDLPRMLSEIFTASEISVHKIKRALVVAKDLKDYRFFETVASNSGQRSKIFQDVAEAKEWLSNK
jgi:hypothetical protein